MTSRVKGGIALSAALLITVAEPQHAADNTIAANATAMAEADLVALVEVIAARLLCDELVVRPDKNRVDRPSRHTADIGDQLGSG